jgi:radical SAM-linked protein
VLAPKAPEEPEPERPAPREPVAKPDPAPVQRVRFRIGRDGAARFLAHLEYATVWQRALRRAGFPVAYTQGFHAQPRVNFATAVPVGEESEADYMDVLLTNAVAPEVLRRTLAGVLPPGFHVYEAWDAPLGAPALMSTVRGFRYRVTVPASAAEMAARVEALLASECLPVSRLAKQGGRKREKTVDVRPMIAGIRVEGEENGQAVLLVETVLVDGRGVKPRELAGCLGVDAATVRFRKTATLFEHTQNTPQIA